MYVQRSGCAAAILFNFVRALHCHFSPLCICHTQVSPPLMMMLRAPSARLCVWGSARGRGMSGVVAQQQGPAAAQLFSHDSAGYAAFRPCYPQALFQWVGQQLPQWSGLALHGLDVGCGTGQATLPLLQLCGEAGRVTACDGSETQLQQLRLQLRERGEQRVQLLHCAAEQLPPRVQGVHVVTVAQAMHWLDWEAFYAQLDRVLLPGGLLVFFGYSLPQLQHPQARAEVWKFYRELLGPYWDPERQHVDAKYTSIPLPPFASSEDKVERKEFVETKEVRLEDYVNYISTWSALKKYRDANEDDPLPKLHSRLRELTHADLEEGPEEGSLVLVDYEYFAVLAKKPVEEGG